MLMMNIEGGVQKGGDVSLISFFGPMGAVRLLGRVYGKVSIAFTMRRGCARMKICGGRFSAGFVIEDERDRERSEAKV